MTPGPVAADGLERYGLLASALAARPLVVMASDIGVAWTDGHSVYVSDPAEPERCAVEAALQAALVGQGSFDQVALGALGPGRRVASRYLALEGDRARRRIARSLPGIGLLQRLELAVEPPSDDIEESVTRARSREPLPPPDPVFGILRRGHLLAGEPVAPPSTAMPAPAGRPVQDPLEELDDDDDDDDDDDPPSRLARLLASPTGRASALGSTLASLLGMRRRWTGEAPEHGGGSVGSSGVGRGKGARGAQVVGLEAPPPPQVTVGESTITGAYPEWDTHQGRYRHEWCRVVDRVAPIDPHAATRVGPPPTWLRAQLAPLARGLERRHRQPSGVDVDLDAVVDAAVSLSMGRTPTDRVHVDLRRGGRDLGVLVLLDASGSGADASPAGGTVLDHQRGAAAALIAVLTELGDRVAAFSFRSHGRAEVRLSAIKRFDEPYSELVHARLASVRAYAFTRFGAAVRHATTLLRDGAGTSRRLLIVLSDGFAYDDGYEGRYAEADARRSLEEARTAGIGCVALNIGGGADDRSLRRVFSASAHARAHRFDDLSGSLAQVFASALAHAEARHRQYERQRAHGTRPAGADGGGSVT